MSHSDLANTVKRGLVSGCPCRPWHRLLILQVNLMIRTASTPRVLVKQARMLPPLRRPASEVLKMHPTQCRLPWSIQAETGADKGIQGSPRGHRLKVVPATAVLGGRCPNWARVTARHSPAGVTALPSPAEMTPHSSSARVTALSSPAGLAALVDLIGCSNPQRRCFVWPVPTGIELIGWMKERCGEPDSQRFRV